MVHKFVHTIHELFVFILCSGRKLFQVSLLRLRPTFDLRNSQSSSVPG